MFQNINFFNTKCLSLNINYWCVWFCVWTIFMLTQFLKVLLAHNARVTQKIQEASSNIVAHHVTYGRHQVQIFMKPKLNCDGPPIWRTQDAIFNLFSFILELKKRDFRTSRIQKISKLDIFNLAGQKKSRKIVLDPEGKYLPKSGLSLFICPYPEIGCTRLG